ncbi:MULTISPECIES: DUF2793 domain-containing protein [unclassified Roseitalea]|uniref:DUF2793 domain-containing protein n=1 Tax=unclassified Roseitalea TaxID=2639107 RepID=UPI00273EC37B|nr:MULTISPECIES: DUF2793 domain-containing protein [unclassified Roseitalea]
MERTPNLDLPYIMPSQAQKHVTHNEAIRALDALVQLVVIDRDRTAPPAEPGEGDRHIVGAGATAHWAGRDGQIAAFQDGAWAYFTAQTGWHAYLLAESRLIAWDGAAWIDAEPSVTEVQNATHVGIQTTADDTNRLAVASAATLLSHAGAGHRLKLNKNAPADTASVVFQTNWSGRAEFGLAGDDDWRVKVSPDGSTWHDAFVVDADTGRLAIAAPLGLASLTVAERPAADTVAAGTMVYVTDGPGGAGLMVSDASYWLRVTTDAFSPDWLFGGGEDGAWCSPADLSTVFEDAAATTQAAETDPVGHVVDRSGNQAHATQAGASLRPQLAGTTHGRLVLDGVDDKLTHTFAGPVVGDLLIAGTDGCWIEEGIDETTLDIGPIDAPISRRLFASGVLGDIVGWLVIDRATTAGERADFVAYYNARGAGALLVAGPELVVNGTFDSDLAGWTVWPDFSAVQNNGKAEVTRNGFSQPSETFTQNVTVENGAFYQVEFEAANALPAREISGVTPSIFGNEGTTGAFRYIVKATGTTMGLRFWCDAGQTVHLDNISVRKLTN